MEAEEFDDPFATPLDKQIESTDISERLQIRLKKRMAPSEQEIAEEADWIFDRLMNHRSLRLTSSGSFESDYKYLYCKKEPTKAKIMIVLAHLRTRVHDVPYIVHYGKHEYARELDEESIWIIYNLDQEYGKFYKQKQ